MSEVMPKQVPAFSIGELLENFEFLEDWDERYAYLVELGEALPAMPEAGRTEQNRVKGCMSQVWVSAEPAPHEPHTLVYHGDCDTAIIKGVLAVLIGLFSGCTPAQIPKLDVEGVFDRLGLKENLSPSRHVGVFAIVELMQQQARELA